MGELVFSWDEAMTVFTDDFALFDDDPDGSDTEDRFVLLGASSRFRLLVVCHTYRRSDSVIRIICARKATARALASYTERRSS
jgi:hypothetical protein